MSHWVEFHAGRIKRLQKFSDFRKDLQLNTNEALGFLGSFWCEVIELAESGDISGWSPEYVCERVGSSLSPERVWNALVKHRWVDKTASGRHLVHDWLDYGGTYLRNKYASRDREKLVEIWALHGRIYGKKEEVHSTQTDCTFAKGLHSVAPKGVGKGSSPPSSDPPKKEKEKKTPARARKALTQIAEDWKPSASTLAWCAKNNLPEPEFQLPIFITYWQGKGDSRADWDASFRNWMISPYRKDKPRGQQNESAAQRNGRRFEEELGKITAGVGAAGGYEVLPLLPETDA
jgi:hypothetical protein